MARSWIHLSLDQSPFLWGLLAFCAFWLGVELWRYLKR
jgi:hypothetical protein